MKPLSERDENLISLQFKTNVPSLVGMKPLSERDENCVSGAYLHISSSIV